MRERNLTHRYLLADELTGHYRVKLQCLYPDRFRPSKIGVTPLWNFKVNLPRRWIFSVWESLFGDPYGNRTHVTAVKGRCLNRLTNGPGSGNLIRTDDIPGMNRLLYQLSYAAMMVNDSGTAEISFIIISKEGAFVKRNFPVFS